HGGRGGVCRPRPSAGKRPVSRAAGGGGERVPGHEETPRPPPWGGGLCGRRRSKTRLSANRPGRRARGHCRRRPPSAGRRGANPRLETRVLGRAYPKQAPTAWHDGKVMLSIVTEPSLLKRMLPAFWTSISPSFGHTSPVTMCSG